MEAVNGDLQEAQRCDSILIAMAFINFIVSTAYAYILPFYPVLAYKDAGLSYALIGILMSVNSVGSTLSAYIFGARIQQLGRKRFYIMSIFSQALVMILYASLYFMTKNFWLFLGVSVFTRVFEGTVRSVYDVTGFTYLNIIWKSGFAQRFSTMEATNSLGQIFGLVFGTLVNYIFGYWVPLLGQAVLFVLCVVIAYFYIPNDDTLEETTEKVKAKLPIYLAFKHKATLITFITLVVTRATLKYYISFFSHHMQSYGKDQDQAALYISLPQFAYIIAMPVIPWILRNNNQNEFISSFSVAFSILGIGIIAPIWTDGTDFSHIWIGLLVMGLGSALNRIPAIPVLMIQLRKIDLPISGKSGLSDMASAIFQMHISITNLIFPVIGGSLYDLYGGQTIDYTQEKSAFKMTTLSLFFVQIISFSVDIAMNGGWKIWVRTFTCKTNQSEMNKLVNMKKENSENYTVDVLVEKDAAPKEVELN